MAYSQWAWVRKFITQELNSEEELELKAICKIAKPKYKFMRKKVIPLQQRKAIEVYNIIELVARDRVIEALTEFITYKWGIIHKLLFRLIFPRFTRFYKLIPIQVALYRNIETIIKIEDNIPKAIGDANTAQVVQNYSKYFNRTSQLRALAKEWGAMPIDFEELPYTKYYTMLRESLTSKKIEEDIRNLQKIASKLKK